MRDEDREESEKERKYVRENGSRIEKRGRKESKKKRVENSELQKGENADRRNGIKCEELKKEKMVNKIMEGKGKIRKKK